MSAAREISFRRGWAPLRNATFRMVWMAAMASNVGTWMQTVGASWLMTTLAVSPLMIALVQTAATLPAFLVGLPAGALADVVDRRRMLIFTQSWMLAAAAALGALTLAGKTGPWTLLLLTFALGLGSSLNGPAWQAAIPELVPREQLPAAVVLNSVQFNIARAIGPALAGLVLAATSAGTVFVLNAVSFLGVIVVFWIWKPERIRHRRESMAEAIRTGWHFVRSASAFHAVLARQGMFVVSASALWALLPVVASRTLHATALDYGVLLGSLGVGAVAAALVLSPLREHYSADTLACTGNLLFAVATAALALVGKFGLLIPAMVAGGMAWMTTMSTFNVAAQSTPPVWMRARALGVYLVVFQASLAGGSALWGAVAERVGARGSLLFSFAALLLTLMVAGPRLRLAPAMSSLLSGESEPDEVVLN